MPTVPPIDDLENLSATGAMLEAVLRQWVQDITECSPPDIVTFAEAVDFFARLTAIRKTLIKLSRLSAPRPSRPSPEKRSRAADLPSSPVGLPTPNIDQIPCVPDVPLDQIRPQLNAIAHALQVVSPSIPDCVVSDCEISPSAPSTQSDPSAPSDPSDQSDRSHSQFRNPQSEIHDPTGRGYG